VFEDLADYSPGTRVDRDKTTSDYKYIYTPIATKFGEITQNHTAITPFKVIQGH